MNPRSPAGWGLGQVLGSLRFKLALLYLIVFAVILGGLSLTLIKLRERDRWQDFDDQVRDAAEVMALQVVVSGVLPPSRDIIRSRGYRRSALHIPGEFFQIRAVDESVIERSEGLRDEALPLTDVGRTAKSSDEPVLELLTGADAFRLLQASGELRLATLYRDPPTMDPFYLQVAMSTEPIEEGLRSMRRTFGVVIPSGLLAAAVASWVLARRSLAPVQKIVERARQISAASLHERLPTPRGRDEAAELVRTLNEMLDRLDKAFQAQERFLSDVSHELKTPLSVLLGEAQVLAQRKREIREYETFIHSVEEEVRSMHQIVDSLLLLARADAGFPMTFTSDVSLNDVVVEAVQRIQPLASVNRVQVRVTLADPSDDGASINVRGDMNLLVLMIGNLVHNAVRFSPQGESVSVRVAVRGVHAEIEVEDRGPGIDHEMTGKLFERFATRRVDSSTGRRQGGSGLGLAIARGVARLHGGDLVASDQFRPGAKFIARLPISVM